MACSTTATRSPPDALANAVGDRTGSAVIAAPQAHVHSRNNWRAQSIMPFGTARLFSALSWAIPQKRSEEVAFYLTT